jgi:hypothetical protein
MTEGDYMDFCTKLFAYHPRKEPRLAIFAGKMWRVDMKNPAVSDDGGETFHPLTDEDKDIVAQYFGDTK